ncbi:MAG: hypothetical protein D6722_28540 [Bacteroidetes bacterium]|nr:MAG: hypothetical protein D6722_28540 [Bacteroidota bacterium]
MRTLFLLLCSLSGSFLWAQPTRTLLVGETPLDSIDAAYIEVDLIKDPSGPDWRISITYGQDCEAPSRIWKKEREESLTNCTGLQQANGSFLTVSGVADLANLMHGLGWDYVEMVPWRPGEALYTSDIPAWAFYLFRRRGI